MSAETKPRTFDSLKAAATALQLPMGVLQVAKAAGCTAFRSNRVYEAELLAALELNPQWYTAGANDPRAEKLREEIRKLRIANDAKEGRLIERALVAQKMQLAAAELNSMRSKWEAEMPDQFGATNGDVVECRMILRGIFDEVFAGIQSLAKHFEEEKRQ